MNVTGTLGGLTLPAFTIPFLRKTVENAIDVTTLDATQYTDFIGLKDEWELNFAKMDESDYNDFIGVYESQFSTGDYPDLVLPYYSVNTPVRMYINDQDVRADGCWMRDVQFRLVRKAAR